MSKLCSSCGKTLDDQIKFCDNCGAAQTQNQVEQSEQTQSGTNQDQTFSADDIEKNKTMAALAYIIFFLPLLACPDSKFGRYHANQGLLLLIFGFIGGIVLTVIPIIGWVLLPVLYIVLLVFAIMGFVNGFKGVAKPLPLFGKFTIIK
ncbi:MAG: hypothetical protein PHZ09_08420 [Eubacteriales bacterium]|jgi:uncharacterized membrane protein|nr:hypothetical protein [Eubacteriales bacterium]